MTITKKLFAPNLCAPNLTAPNLVALSAQLTFARRYSAAARGLALLGLGLLPVQAQGLAQNESASAVQAAPSQAQLTQNQASQNQASQNQASQNQASQNQASQSRPVQVQPAPPADTVPATSAPAPTPPRMPVDTAPSVLPRLLPLPAVTVSGPPAAALTTPAMTVPIITVPPETVPVVAVPPTTAPITGPITGPAKGSGPAPTEPAHPLTIHAAHPSNMRGLWVDAFGAGLKTPVQVGQLIADAQALGVNTLFVQTIRRADCLCNLASVPRAADHDLAPGFDPLAAVITLAHAHNIRVIAWVSVTGAGSSNAPNPSPAHVLQQHGPLAGAASWVNRRADGTYLEGGDIWLDAGIPAASDFMAQSILSLVKNYNIDGIQFDRIRYPDGGNWGYSPLALTRYRAETGTVGTPAATDPRWTDWKRQQITALVRRVALEARLQKPELWITAATITYGAPPADLAGFQKSRTYSDVVQDWPTWSQTGLLDLNVLMNYKQDAVPNHIQWFDGWNAFALSVAGAGEAAAGTALYLNTPQVSRDQYLRATALGMGWVGYAYRTPTLDVYRNGLPQPQGFEGLRQKLTAPAKTLNVGPWTATPPQRYGLLGHIRGPLLPGGRLVEAYSAAGTLLATTQTDGSGYYGFASLPAGVVDVRIEGQHWQQPLVRPGVVKLPDILLRDTKLVPARVAPAPASGASAVTAPIVTAPAVTAPQPVTLSAHPVLPALTQGAVTAPQPALLFTQPAPKVPVPPKIPVPKVTVPKPPTKPKATHRPKAVPATKK